MATQSIATIKAWFTTGSKPIQNQFWDWIDSFWHKSDNIPMSQISGLDDALSGLPTQESVDALLGQISGLEISVDEAATINVPTGGILEVLVFRGAAQTISLGTSIGGSDIFRDDTDGSDYTLRLDRYSHVGETIHVSCDLMNLKYWTKS